MNFINAFKRIHCWQDICQLHWKNRLILYLSVIWIQIILKTHFLHVLAKPNFSSTLIHRHPNQRLNKEQICSPCDFPHPKQTSSLLSPSFPLGMEKNYNSFLFMIGNCYEIKTPSYKHPYFLIYLITLFNVLKYLKSFLN